ncbi:MAG: FAD-dependent oxidoreductase [Maritimibacter sp.]
MSFELKPKSPLKIHDAVLIGGGHAHALVLRALGRYPLGNTRLTLINPGPTAPYSGMLPGHIAGHYPRETLDIDLVDLARFARAELVFGAADAIDLERKVISVKGREIAYDVASIDVGIHAQMPELEGFLSHGVAVKPLDGISESWRLYLEAIKAGKAPERVAVIGGGVAGAEIAMAMAHAMKSAGRQGEVTVIDAGAGLLGLRPKARKRISRAMGDLNVTLREHSPVARVEQGAVVLANGARIAAGFIVGAGGARAYDWLAASDLPVNDEGFVFCDPTLQVTGVASLFAVGDCAYMPHAPRPKAGVYAVRAAPILAHNLRVAVSGEGKMAAFHPQRDVLKLMSLGGKSALAQKWGIVQSGALWWRWKDRIDRRFMAQFTDYD